MIGNIPARTLAGLRVKARALQVLGHEWCDYFDEQMPPETLPVQPAGQHPALSLHGHLRRGAIMHARSPAPGTQGRASLSEERAMVRFLMAQ